jgi:hypothetical protein
MNNIFLNSDLLKFTNEYTDLKSLYDTCSLFATLKKYIDYKLNKKYSLMYYNDILFRNKVLNKIFNPYKQLYLNFTCGDNITDVSPLNNVHTLKIIGCYNITDVSALNNVHTLDLSECKNITNVNVLRNVHTLILTGCENITDVSELGNVHTLNLTGCDKITDFSALKNIYDLDLKFCDTITDFSIFKNNFVLNIVLQVFLLGHLVP